MGSISHDGLPVFLKVLLVFLIARELQVTSPAVNVRHPVEGAQQKVHHHKPHKEVNHDRDLVEWSMVLPRLLPGNIVPQSNGTQRDETEVNSIQEGPVILQIAKHRRWHHEEAKNHQQEEKQEVDGCGAARSQARVLEESDGGVDQREHQTLDAGSQNQHGEGHA